MITGIDAEYFNEPDIAELLDMQDNDGDGLLVGLIYLYASAGTQIINKIQTAFANKNALALKTNAHPLKSSSASLGLVKMRDQSLYLEKHAGLVISANDEQVITKLQSCFEKSLEVIRSYIAKKYSH